MEFKDRIWLWKYVRKKIIIKMHYHELKSTQKKNQTIYLNL